MTQERWLAVPGYEGSYEVSCRGRVRSLDRRDSRGHRRRGKLLTPGAAEGAHPTVALCVNGIARSHHVHRLVLLAFVGPRPEDMQACHWNDDPTDNRIENLRWDTPSANSLDSVRNGTHPKSRITHCPKGHEYRASNTYNHPSGGRICRECISDRRRAARKTVS